MYLHKQNNSVWNLYGKPYFKKSHIAKTERVNNRMLNLGICEEVTRKNFKVRESVGIFYYSKYKLLLKLCGYIMKEEKSYDNFMLLSI